jgi:hypothetical protein
VYDSVKAASVLILETEAQSMIWRRDCERAIFVPRTFLLSGSWKRTAFFLHLITDDWRRFGEPA